MDSCIVIMYHGPYMHEVMVLFSSGIYWTSKMMMHVVYVCVINAIFHTSCVCPGVW